MLLSPRIGSFLAVLVLTGCGGGSRQATTPHADTKLTSASSPGRSATAIEGAGRIEKILVTDEGSMSVVERDGCLATIQNEDELHTRCAKPERMKAWFEAADQSLSKAEVELMTKEQLRIDDSSSDEKKARSVRMLTAGGKALRLTKSAEVSKFLSDVHALEGELAGAEKVTPGPATEGGWQMVHVAGPAHVLFAGAPTRGMLDARLSTNGQYLCEFTTTSAKATKSGWIKPASAAHVIDVVLAPWSEQGATEGARSTSFAAGTKGGTEQRSNPAATAAVFELFSEVQDALGDACLPELESPSPHAIGL